MKPVIIIAIAFVLLVPLSIFPAFAVEETIFIEGNSGISHEITFGTDCIVTASFTINGGSNEIRFGLVGPENEIIFFQQFVTNEVEEFFFKAKQDGKYKFQFFNLDSTDKLVKLSYEKDCPDIIGGGCLIATATFGSELSPQVQQLRELRDNKLLNTELGTSFMNSFNEFYYSFSPIIADYERENPVFKEMVKVAITPMISSLSILNYVDMDSEAEVLGYGISLILLNIGMYVGIPAVVIIGIRKRL